MANFVKFRLTGMGGISNALRQLPKALSDRVLKRALAASAQPVVDYAVATAKFTDHTGETRGSIGVRPMRRKRFGSEVAIGPNSPKAHLVEFGTKAHRIEARKGGFLSWLGIVARSVEHPGSRPKPFFRPAWDLKGGPAMLADLGARIWAELAAAADRLSKRASSGRLSVRDFQELG